MPRSATATRERLIEAGETQFATKGVDGALIRDIVRVAGQANDSAVSYHFGSRLGLLEAILDKHIAHMEHARRTAMETAPTGELRAVVEALVRPTADRLRTPEGRAFLRIIVQLTDATGVRSHQVPGPLHGTTLAEQLAIIEDLMPGRSVLRRERLTAAILLLTGSLAERARRIDEGRRTLLGTDTFVANLVEMLVAMLTAPGPSPRGR